MPLVCIPTVADIPSILPSALSPFLKGILSPSEAAILLAHYINNGANLPTTGRVSTIYAKDTGGNYTAFTSGNPVVTDNYVVFQPQDTNLCAQSIPQASVSPWQAPSDCALALNDLAAPDGATTATKITENGGTVSPFHYFSHSVTSGNTYSWTMWIRGTGIKWIYLLGLASGFPAAERIAYFDLETGVTGTVETNVSASITDEGGGWYRCTITITANATAASGFLIRLTTADGNTAPHTGAGRNCHVWGSTLRENVAHDLAHTLPPIPTSGSTATTTATEADIIWPTADNDDFVIVATIYTKVSYGTLLTMSNSGSIGLDAYSTVGVRTTQAAPTFRQVVDADGHTIGTPYEIRISKSSTQGLRFYRDGVLQGTEALAAGETFVMDGQPLQLGTRGSGSHYTLYKDVKIAWGLSPGITDAEVLAI